MIFVKQFMLATPNFWVGPLLGLHAQSALGSHLLKKSNKKNKEVSGNSSFENLSHKKCHEDPSFPFVQTSTQF